MDQEQESVEGQGFPKWTNTLRHPGVEYERVRLRVPMDVCRKLGVMALRRSMSTKAFMETLLCRAARGEDLVPDQEQYSSEVEGDVQEVGK